MFLGRLVKSLGETLKSMVVIDTTHHRMRNGCSIPKLNQVAQSSEIEAKNTWLLQTV